MFPQILTMYEHACFEAFSNKKEELEEDCLKFEKKPTDSKFSPHIHTFKTQVQYLT
ncbi:hypothetical protein NEF87_002077 [Candidatus Lokiarchaeum ossiferum]|uniref:Uncharacterized protein n=1 Tax=Candidatus Lokiarchaeum ossiferum TaxID=2951803 RepID=A0ABY6HSG0_9ARCH|nr:hypothetical protein NEF87_002077 [Candidatus Lokiarchaeum sp. B-35]